MPDPQDPDPAGRRSIKQPRTGRLRELYGQLLRRCGRPPRRRRAAWRPPRGRLAGVDAGPGLEVVGNFAGEAAEVPVRERRELVLATSPDGALDDGRLALPPLSGAVLR